MIGGPRCYCYQRVVDYRLIVVLHFLEEDYAIRLEQKIEIQIKVSGEEGWRFKSRATPIRVFADQVICPLVCESHREWCCVVFHIEISCILRMVNDSVGAIDTPLEARRTIRPLRLAFQL